MAGRTRWRYGAGALLVAGLVAGCGSGGYGDGHGSGSGQGTAAAGSTAAAPAPPPATSADAATTPAATTPAPPATSASGTSASGTSETRPSSAAPPPAGVGSCYDGTCEITVSRPVTIPVDSRFGFSSFKVTHIGTDGVTIRASGRGTDLESGVSPGGTAALNGISVRVRSVHGHTADLAISHS
jgi:hypothetical protein